MTETTARWTRWDGGGLELCRLAAEDGGWRLEGVVADSRGGGDGVHWRVDVAADWTTRRVRVRLVSGATLDVEADGRGAWRDRPTGAALPALEGALDVDIGVTPATNTLPIRRLALADGQAAEITAAYVPLPDQIGDGPFLPRPAAQRYTRLGRRLWRYEGLFRGFSAELAVDADGLVLDYPDTFRRLP